MGESLSDRKLAENEVIFRQANRKVERGLQQALAEERAELVLPQGNDDIMLQFYCECADGTCSQRINLKISKYQALHKNNAQFVIIPGHEVARIEKVIKKTKKYYVVEKYIEPPKEGKTLHV